MPAGTGTLAAGGVGGAAAALTAIGDFGTVDAVGILATGGDGGATGESGIWTVLQDGGGRAGVFALGTGTRS